MSTVTDTIDKVRRFSTLVELKNNTIEFLKVARELNILRSNAFMGENGEIQIIFYREDYLLELTFELDGSVTIAEDTNDKQSSFEEQCSLLFAATKFVNWCE